MDKFVFLTELFLFAGHARCSIFRNGGGFSSCSREKNAAGDPGSCRFCACFYISCDWAHPKPIYKVICGTMIVLVMINLYRERHPAAETEPLDNSEIPVDGHFSEAGKES